MILVRAACVIFMASTAVSCTAARYAQPPCVEHLADKATTSEAFDDYKVERTGNLWTGYTYGRKADGQPDRRLERQTDFGPLFYQYQDTRESYQRAQRYGFMSRFVFPFIGLMGASLATYPGELPGSDRSRAITGGSVAAGALALGIVSYFLQQSELGGLGEPYNQHLRADLEAAQKSATMTSAR